MLWSKEKIPNEHGTRYSFLLEIPEEDFGIYDKEELTRNLCLIDKKRGFVKNMIEIYAQCTALYLNQGYMVRMIYYFDKFSDIDSARQIIGKLIVIEYPDNYPLIKNNIILENFRYLVINTEYNPSIFNIFAFNDKFLLETLILKEKRKALV